MVQYAWVVAFTGTLTILLAQGFGRLSYSVILPSMKNGLLLTYTQAGLVGTANFVGYLTFAFAGGFLAVRFGARRIIFVSLLVMGASLFLTGFSDSFAAAFLLRLVAGMGNGGAVVPTMALTASWFVMGKRGLAAGIPAAGTGIGLSLVGFVLPGLMRRFGPDGWRYAWFSIGILVFFLSFVCYAFLRDYPSEKRTALGDSSLFSAFGSVVRAKEVWKLGMVYFIFGFSYIIYMTFFVAYLTSEAGLTATVAGRMFAVLGLCSILSGVLWGRLSDVLGRRWGSLLAFLALGSSYVIFAACRTVPAFYVSSILFGFTLSSLPTIVAAGAGDSMGARLAPAALGFITLLFGIGQSLGPAVAGWVKDTTGTFAGAFVLSFVISLFGAAASTKLGRKAGK